MNAPVFPALAPTAEQQASIRLRVLSLGAGVRSTTLALMAAQGEISPLPDCAIFADTGWEPKAVYDHLAWLRSPNVLPFPVHIVSAGDLRADLLAGARGEAGFRLHAFLLLRRCPPESERAALRFVTGSGPRERLSAPVAES